MALPDTAPFPSRYSRCGRGNRVWCGCFPQVLPVRPEGGFNSANRSLHLCSNATYFDKPVRLRCVPSRVFSPDACLHLLRIDGRTGTGTVSGDGEPQHPSRVGQAQDHRAAAAPDATGRAGRADDRGARAWTTSCRVYRSGHDLLVYGITLQDNTPGDNFRSRFSPKLAGYY